MGINNISVAGIVAEEPTFLSNSFYGTTLEVKLDINRKELGKVERIACLIIDDDLIDRGLEEIKTGDFLVCQFAQIITLEYLREKFFVCPHCGKESRRIRRATQSDIILHDFNLSKNVTLDDSVGINKAFAMGIVRNEVQDKNGREMTKFQLVVNRSKRMEDHLRNSAPENFKVEVVDIPNVVCFGSLANKAFERVKKGNFILVEGAIQERDTQQQIPFRCKHCGEYSEQFFEYTLHDIVAQRVSPQQIYIKTLEEVLDTDSLVNTYGEHVADHDSTTAIQAAQNMVKLQEERLERKAARRAERKAKKAADKAANKKAEPLIINKD